MDKQTIFDLARHYGEQAYSDDCGFFPEGGSRPAERELENALDEMFAEIALLRMAIQDTMNWCYVWGGEAVRAATRLKASLEAMESPNVNVSGLPHNRGGSNE